MVNLTSRMENKIANSYHFAPAPESVIQEALTQKLTRIRETASVLYKRMMDKIRYGRERF